MQSLDCKMSKNYTHLSIDQRYQLLKTGATQKEIACIVHFHPSTISRELKRNVGSRGRGAGVYRTANAQRRSSSSRKAKKSDFHQTHERLDS